MTKEKMTLHRALSELKLIDSKIEKSINTIEPSGVAQKGKLVNNVYDQKEFEKNAKAKYNSTIDLIKRKNKIKSAVVLANSKTKVEISGKSMTIAEAINYKSTVDFKKTLLNRLRSFHNGSKASLNKANDQVNTNALELAKAALQKDNVKINDGDAVAITEPYIEKNEFHLVDPLNIEDLTEEMDDEISEFETNIDAVLSEINAITIIEI